MVWWLELGYPPFDLGRGGFPRTGQILKYYRERKRDENGKPLKQEALARALGITEQAVGNLENQDVSMDADRRRLLCKLLDIPPILFGIIMLEELLTIKEQQKEKVFWWVQRGYPSFAPGKDGFLPRTGQVVKYYRERKMDDKSEAWTQEALARVLGISEQAVRDIENKDVGMDHDRRHFLCRLFGIPPILFGIISLEEIDLMVEQRKRETDASIFSPPLLRPHKATIDTTEYHEYLASRGKTNSKHTAYGAMAESLLRIEALYCELHRVRVEGWPYLQELLCGYHQFVATLLRDHRRYDTAIVHLNKAFRFAKWLKKDELTALVLHRRGNTLLDAGRVGEAVRDYEKARRYEKVPYNLKGSILLQAGVAGAKAAESDKGRQKDAIRLIDLGGQIASAGYNEEDPHFLKLNLNRYHLDKGAALIAVGRNQDAIDELKLVKSQPEYLRGQAYNDILQAQANINLGKYSEAAGLAVCGLVVVQKIGSKVNIARVEKIHEQLQKSTFKNNPETARLDYLLFKR